MLHLCMSKFVVTNTEKNMSEKGFAALVDGDIQLKTKSPLVQRAEQVKLSKYLYLHFIREIDVKSWSVTVSHFTRTN